MIRRSICMAACSATLFASLAAEAAVIKFVGESSGRSVSGILEYDENTPPDDTLDAGDVSYAYYFPGTLRFVSGALSRSGGVLAVVADAEAGNLSGAIDAFTAFVVAGGSGREQYSFSVNWPEATTLTSDALPSKLPQGTAAFWYEYAGDGFSIPVSFHVAAIPEPATWIMMVGGIGFVGLALRRSRSKTFKRRPCGLASG